MKKTLYKFLNLSGFKLHLVSAEQIISWTLRKFQDTILIGEVSEPLTLNFIKGYVEPNGLFCERIFGPVSSWKCLCGQKDPFKFENKEQLYFCKFCGLELNDKRLRRYRTGYILLNTPLVHAWYFKNTLPLFLNSSVTKLEQLLYYKIILSEIKTKTDSLNVNNVFLLFASHFVQKLLKRINLLNEFILVQEKLLNEKSLVKRKFLIKKAKILHLFFINNIKPHWLLLEALPVIPPGLRPFLQLPNNTFIISPLNIAYKQIIVRNNRLSKWVGMKNFIPIIFEIIEKQNLQYSVDSLLSSTSAESGRNLSLIQALKGKFGRFRQNLLGKRIDFSGRSVIISGPDLLLNEIGVPSPLAVELYKPQLLNILKNNTKLKTLLKASLITQYSPTVLKLILTKIFNTECVLLNRAPTLHKMNLQAFQPRLVENNALKLYPIACSKFNADFDGDQMGIFLTISYSAKKEAKSLLTLDKNIFSAASGYNMHKPSLSMVLGLHSLLNFINVLDTKLCLNNVEDVISTYTHGLIKIQDPIWLKQSVTFNSTSIFKKQQMYIYTSVGKLLLQVYLQLFK